MNVKTFMKQNGKYLNAPNQHEWTEYYKLSPDELSNLFRKVASAEKERINQYLLSAAEYEYSKGHCDKANCLEYYAVRL